MTTQIDFGNRQQISVHARYICDRLDLRALENARYLGRSPLAIGVGEHGCAVLFRYGVVVMFNLTAVEETSFLDSLSPYVMNAFEKCEDEITVLTLEPNRGEGVDVGAVNVQVFSVERLQVVAEVLAKSCVLAHYEMASAGIFDRIEPLAETLRRTGRGGYRNRDLLRQIGDILLMHHRMVGRVEVRDKPETLWEHPDMERLYHRLVDEYELSERHGALNRKLRLITQTAETLIELMRHRSTLRVEWYIVILIVVEIVLMAVGFE